MNTLQKALVAIVAGSLLSVSAQAAVYSNANVGQAYVGAKVGKLGIGIDSANDPVAYGIYGGYNFDPNLGVEAEYIGAREAEFKDENFKGTVDSKTYGAYGTYRYYLPNTNFYGKGKLGIAKTDVKSKVVEVVNKNSKKVFSDTSKGSVKFAGGVGIGFAPTPNIGIEAEYARVGNDVDAVTLGAHLKF